MTDTQSTSKDLLMAVADLLAKMPTGQNLAAYHARDEVMALRAAVERTAHEPESVPVDEFPPCMVPPKGWVCTRAPGHDGPCAAHPVDEIAASQIEGFKAAVRSANRAYIRIVRETAKIRHAQLPEEAAPTPAEVREYTYLLKMWPRRDPIIPDQLMRIMRKQVETAWSLRTTQPPSDVRAEITKWRDDALEAAAQICDRYGLDAYGAGHDIRMLKSDYKFGVTSPKGEG